MTSDDCCGSATHAGSANGNSPSGHMLCTRYRVASEVAADGGAGDEDWPHDDKQMNDTMAALAIIVLSICRSSPKAEIC